MKTLSERLWDWYDAQGDLPRELRRYLVDQVRHLAEARILYASDVAVSAGVSRGEAANAVLALAKSGIVKPASESACPSCGAELDNLEGQPLVCASCKQDLLQVVSDIGWELDTDPLVDGGLLIQRQNQLDGLDRLTSALVAGHVYFIKIDLMKSTLLDQLQETDGVTKKGIGNLAKDFLWRRLLPASTAHVAYAVVLSQPRGDDATILVDNLDAAFMFIEHFASTIFRNQRLFTAEIEALGVKPGSVPPLRVRAHLLVLPSESRGDPQYSIQFTGEGSLDINGLPRTRAERVAANGIDKEWEATGKEYAIAFYLAAELETDAPKDWQGRWKDFGVKDTAKNPGEALKQGLYGIFLPVI